VANSSGARPNISHIPAKILNNGSFLNALRGHVNQWIKPILSVTKLTRHVSSGTASEELNFWLSLKRALRSIEIQLRNDEVNNGSRKTQVPREGTYDTELMRIPSNSLESR
jgi:hypothetical protein